VNIINVNFMPLHDRVRHRFVRGPCVYRLQCSLSGAGVKMTSARTEW